MLYFKGLNYFRTRYFDNQYEDEWIIDKLSIEMIKDMDKVDVISTRLIDSPILGLISVKELSGGVKTLMLFGLKSLIPVIQYII